VTDAKVGLASRRLVTAWFLASPIDPTFALSIRRPIRGLLVVVVDVVVGVGVGVVVGVVVVVVGVGVVVVGVVVRVGG
jgi:hypothetical protein